MSSPLETQAKVWVDTISSEATISAYQSVLKTLIAAVTALWDAILVSWNIIKETGKLAWLFICFGLVASDWLWDGGKNVVTKVKKVTSHAGDPKSDTYIIDTGKALFEASKTTAVKAVSQAREQLGIPKDGTAGTTNVAPAPPKAEPANSPKAEPTAKAPKTDAPETGDASTEDA